MSSLLSTCKSILAQLDRVPLFQELFPKAERIDTHPVSALWYLYRLGNPLVVLFNAAVVDIHPPVDLCPEATADNLRECKKATMSFLRGMISLGAVVSDLVPGTESWGAGDLFTVSEPLQHSTDGLVKVNNTVMRLLSIMQSRNLLSPVSEEEEEEEDAPPTVKKEYIIRELITTERAYVAHLDTLQTVRSKLVSGNVLSHESAYKIFANLPALTDVQRKFCVALDGSASEDWPAIFLAHEQELEVYIPYVANLTGAQQEAVNQKAALDSSGIMTQTEMDQFISRPFQRLVKYDQLLAAWLKETPDNQQLRLAHEMSVRLLHKVDSGVALRLIEQANAQKAAILQTRINNFKEPEEMRSFGKLLLSDTLKIKLHSSESEYFVYIFEALLLCCKIVDEVSKDYNRYSTPASLGSSSPASTPTKRKNSLKKAQSRDSTNSLSERARDAESLRIKGRVFFRNVTGAYKFGTDGNKLAVWWRNRSEQEMLILHCHSDTQFAEWTKVMNERIAHYVTKRRMTYEAQGPVSAAPLSATGSFASQGLLSAQSPGRLTRRSTSPWVMSMVDEPEQISTETVPPDRYQEESVSRSSQSLAASPRIYSASRPPPPSASLSFSSSPNNRNPTTPPQVRKPNMPARSMTASGIDAFNLQHESPNSSPKLQSSVLASPLNSLRQQQFRGNSRRPSRDDLYGSPSSFSLSQPSSLQSSPQMRDIGLGEHKPPSHSFNPNYTMSESMAAVGITGSPLRKIPIDRSQSEVQLSSSKQTMRRTDSNSPNHHGYKVPESCDFACKIRFEDHTIVTGLRKTDKWASLYRTVWKSIHKATQREELGSLRVRWLDPDGDLVALATDEDVSMIIDWAEGILPSTVCVELLIHAENGG